MAWFLAKSLLLISVLVLLSTSSFTVVLADEFDDIVSFVQLPQALLSHPPAEPPKSHRHHHHHKHAPTPAPVKPPVKPSPPSVKPPTPTPSPPSASPPSYPVTRKLFAVQGVVYCKSCKYSGIDTLLGASPLVGQSLQNYSLLHIFIWMHACFIFFHAGLVLLISRKLYDD